MDTKIKIGITVTPDKKLPAWECALLEKLIDSQLVTALIFIITPPPKKEKKAVWLWLFQQFENKWFRRLPDAARLKPIEAVFSNPSVVSCADYGKICEINPAIIYQSSTTEKIGIPGFSPAFGYWTIFFGDKNRDPEYPTGFDEVMQHKNEIWTRLLARFPGRDSYAVVFEMTCPTVPYSVKNTFNILAWESSFIPLYRFKELTENGFEKFCHKYATRNFPFSHTQKMTSKKQGMLFLIIRNFYRYLLYKIKPASANKRFTLLYKLRSADKQVEDLKGFIPLKLPAHTFWADPFVIEKNDTTYIFFEEYDYRIQKAHISLITMKKEGVFSDAEIILEKPYHLSYPFVFEWEEAYYMIPESGENKTVDLYKATEFPGKWEKAATLIEGHLLTDATLIFYNDTWWLFANTENLTFTATNNKLVLYYSDSLFSGDWKPHPQNPVQSKLASCRPAGRIYQINDELFRPSQNNASPQYGYAVCINKITKLTKTEYEEEEVISLTPGKENNLLAVHTYNFTPSMAVIDGIVKNKSGPHHVAAFT